VLIELSLNALIENFPRSRDAIDLEARSFNRLFRYRWDRVVEFLKLHYVLSERTEPYWRDNRDPAAMPEGLSELLRMWRDREPSTFDLPEVEEIFPAASYQYVLYGMGFSAPPARPFRTDGDGAALFRQVGERARTLTSALPTNRAYLDALRQAHAPVPVESRL